MRPALVLAAGGARRPVARAVPCGPRQHAVPGRGGGDDRVRGRPRRLRVAALARPGRRPRPQTWTVEPGGPGTDLTVRWAGAAGYALADERGRPEPWGLSGHAGYQLVRSGAGWALATWTRDTDAPLTAGWPSDVPVPDGYLPVSDAPAADPAALEAVRGAAAAWRAAQGSTSATTVTTDGQGATAQGRSVTGLAGTTTAAPAGGDATSTYGYDGATTGHDRPRPRRRLPDPDAGHRDPRAVPGRTLPARLAWTSTDDARAADGNAGYPVDPFALAALLGGTDAAAPAACPTDLPADRCYTALVVTNDACDPLAGQLSGVSHRAGRAHLVLDIGLDKRGRPAHLRLAQDVRVFGQPGTRLTGTPRYTGWTDTPPPPAAAPDPTTVDDDDDVDF